MFRIFTRDTKSFGSVGSMQKDHCDYWTILWRVSQAACWSLSEKSE